jgi:lipopolysaccharide biosynthesis glycosyltransferase
MKILIITATDETYMPWIKRLANSLQAVEAFRIADFACLDLGLGKESRSAISEYCTQIICPEWDLPVDEEIARSMPHLRALTARPFLPRYFPGYDIYLWIDSDTWVQGAFAINWLLAASQHGALAAVPETDRSYSQSQGIWSWRFEFLNAYYGNEAAQRLITESYLNAGVFALRGDAPHWKVWEEWFRRGLSATSGKVVSDQTALNQAVWAENLSVHPLPALCNWLCHLAMPVQNQSTGHYHEPHVPQRPIGILHETGDTKGSTGMLTA